MKYIIYILLICSIFISPVFWDSFGLIGVSSICILVISVFLYLQLWELKSMVKELNAKIDYLNKELNK